MKASRLQYGCCSVVIIAVIVGMVVVLVIILQDGGTRKIPVQYAKKMQGRKTGRRSVHPYSTKGKYCRCYPGYLCVIPDAASR